MDTLTLYKYRPLDERALEIVRSLRLWFPFAASLNDTFEFSVPVYIRIGPEELVQHYLKRFKLTEVSHKVLGAMMAHGGGGEIPLTDQFAKDFIGASAANRSLFYMAMVHHLNSEGMAIAEIAKRLRLDQDAELVNVLLSELRGAYDANQAVGRQLGVLSLSASNADPLMWAHYADSCRGICLGITFDVDELAESDFLPLWVQYLEELPQLSPGEFFDVRKANLMDLLKLFYGTKHTSWSHEQEFRLVSRQGNVGLPVPGKITEVVLGEKVDADRARAAIAVIREATSARILKMMREPGTWRYRPFALV
jgi:hypothetical protein